MKETRWHDFRLLKSILGNHLLVKSAGKTQHLDPGTLELMPLPDQADLRLLINDAISQNTRRYGQISHFEGTTAITTTKIKITVDWNQLIFSQKGRDRVIIDLLYKAHYLQWTPWPVINRVLGFAGLLLVVTLSILGIKIYISSKA